VLKAVKVWRRRSGCNASQLKAACLSQFFDLDCGNRQRLIEARTTGAKRLCARLLPSCFILTVPLLEFQSVFVQRGTRLALNGLSLRVQAGEHVAILGPNGSGKSTLIKTITRECYPLLRPETQLRILGQQNWNIFDLRSHLGVVSNDLMAQCTRDITGRELVLSGFLDRWAFGRTTMSRLKWKQQRWRRWCAWKFRTWRAGGWMNCRREKPDAC